MIFVVMGGQAGSEGKGEVVGYLASQYFPHAVVRTGGPNAGHTATVSGVKYPMRQIPCAWHVPNTQLFIGPGSLVDPQVLIQDWVRIAPTFQVLRGPDIELQDVLMVDWQATLMIPDYRHRETTANLTARIGSTGEGIGAARAARIMREAHTCGDVGSLPGESAGLSESSSFLHPLIEDVPSRLSEILDYPPPSPPAQLPLFPHSSGFVICESTQGFGLSLHASGFYPYCTSADITPGHILGEAGLSSRRPHRVIAVVRSFPIRVGGNSGPMFNEMTWEELHSHNPLIPLEGERTTVTQRVRRVGMLDFPALSRMATICKPDGVVLTFADYIDPNVCSAHTFHEAMRYPAVSHVIRSISDACGCPVIAVSIGPGRILEREGVISNWLLDE